MKEQLVAQKREGANNTVHLYDGTTEIKNVLGRNTEVEPALCSGSPPLSTHKNDDEKEYTVDISELDEEEYLVREGEVIGKICGHCSRIALGKLFESN